MQSNYPYQGYNQGNQGYNQPYNQGNQGYNQGYNQAYNQVNPGYNQSNQGYNQVNQGNQGIQSMQVQNQPSPNVNVQINKPFMIASLVSWGLAVITGCLSFLVHDLGDLYIYWDYILDKSDKNSYIDPLYINEYFFYFIGSGILLSLTVGLCYYFYCLFIKKDNNIINTMQSEITKYNFIPFLCIAILFMIGEIITEGKNIKGVHYFSNLFIALIALGTLIVLNIKTKFENPGYPSIAIKQGAFSCAIALLVHDICYVIASYGFYKKDKKYNKIEDYDDNILNYLKGCNIAFSIIIGICNSILTFILKEISIPCINLLIYVGMLVNLIGMTGSEIEKYCTYYTIYLDLIMIVISLAFIAILFRKWRVLYLGQPL